MASSGKVNSETDMRRGMRRITYFLGTLRQILAKEDVMEQERRAIRIGLVLILFAVIWKVVGGGTLSRAGAFFRKPEVASFLVYLETGRLASLPSAGETGPRLSEPAATEPAADQTEQTQAPPAQTEQSVPPLQFTAADADHLELYKACSYSVDACQLLQSELSWNLVSQEPTVLIVHTHATESYLKNGADYVESGSYRTLNEQYNMVRVGQRLAQQLEAQGIRVIHDRTLHDYPSYTGSYNNSRKTVQQYLSDYPSIQLVLDVHRDAVELSNGKQMDTAASVDGKTAAQLMLVSGSDAGGLSYPNWRQNLSLAAKLQVTLEKKWPGICRPLCFRKERFNQDLSPGMLLVEVGTAGNTLDEALLAADALAWGITQLAKGAGGAG